jgi:hypothetical protein
MGEALPIDFALPDCTGLRLFRVVKCRKLPERYDGGVERPEVMGSASLTHPTLAA